MNYNRIAHLSYVATCVGITKRDCEVYKRGAKRANKRAINKLVKKLLPDLYNELALNFRNPYNYYRTSKHLIVVHSGIEYFIEYN